jgi:hypothetical protein
MLAGIRPNSVAETAAEKDAATSVAHRAAKRLFTALLHDRSGSDLLKTIGTKATH